MRLFVGIDSKWSRYQYYTNEKFNTKMRWREYHFMTLNWLPLHACRSCHRYFSSIFQLWIGLNFSKKWIKIFARASHEIGTLKNGKSFLVCSFFFYWKKKESFQKRLSQTVRLRICSLFSAMKNNTGMKYKKNARKGVKKAAKTFLRKNMAYSVLVWKTTKKSSYEKNQNEMRRQGEVGASNRSNIIFLYTNRKMFEALKASFVRAAHTLLFFFLPFSVILFS